MFEEATDAAAVGEAEHVAYLLGGDPASAMRDRLIENRKTVARRALRRPSNHSQRVLLDLDALGLRHFGEMSGELLGRDTAEIEALGSGKYRERNLVHFRRREQKLHMLRRFLKSLQQSVESTLRKHVNFVDDVDLVTRVDRCVAHRVNDLADVVHTSV